MLRGVCRGAEGVREGGRGDAECRVPYAGVGCCSVGGGVQSGCSKGCMGNSGRCRGQGKHGVRVRVRACPTRTQTGPGNSCTPRPQLGATVIDGWVFSFGQARLFCYHACPCHTLAADGAAGGSGQEWCSWWFRALLCFEGKSPRIISAVRLRVAGLVFAEQARCPHL